MDWVRLYHDMPTDPKWRVIAMKSGHPISSVISVFVFVLTNASANGADRGRLNNLDPEAVGAALDLSDQAVMDILKAMEGRVINDGRLVAWDARNPKREDDASNRTRDWRRRKVTQRDAPVTQGDAPEADTETEEEVAATRTREENSTQIHRLNRILGFSESDFHAQASNIRTLVDLKREGCDFEKHIVPAAEQAAKAGRAKTLSYIRPKAHELRDAAKVVAALPVPFENTDERGWRDRLRVFADSGSWNPKWGPKPDEQGCKCPAPILAERKTAA